MPGGGVVHVPVEWLAEYADLPDDLDPRTLSEAFVRIGLEVEKVALKSDGISGRLVVGRVVSFADEPQKNGKTIRWCQVDVDEPEPRGIVCGAHNFDVDDLVVVALPGTVLPGGFGINARKTYGHVSDGMICSARELGLGDDQDGILVLRTDGAKPGDDATDVLGMNDAVLTLSVTPDRGYCLSVRGLAREAAGALRVQFHDIADRVPVPEADGRAYPVTVDDPAGCDKFSARAIRALNPNAPTPELIKHRLRAAGMRPISLAVDVTNYVMLETGQPLHAFDRAKLTGAIGVRRAAEGEKLQTLDGKERELDPEDLVVTDESGPVAIAGVMGGASTEIGDQTTAIVLEAAHWDPTSIARTVRRHRLPSEAAKRFERGVDPAIAGVALQRCVDLLVEHGGATAVDGYTVVGDGPAPVRIAMPARRPGELAGMPIETMTVVSRLNEVGCDVEANTATPPDREIPEVILQVTPPSWRPDLVDPADLVEEVVRLEGYDKIPSELPAPPPGVGLTETQTQHRAVSRALAAAGFTEVLTYPFVSASVHDTFGEPADDLRRRTVVLVNPLSDAEPELRTSLLAGLLSAVHRNLSRGLRDVSLFEMGLVYLPQPDAPVPPRLGVDQRPSEYEIAKLNASVPDQPAHVAVVLTGDVERPGWWGPGRAATWADAIEAARTVAAAYRAELELRQVAHAPWHPGRCAELVLDGVVVGHAGELHPRVLAALGLPERTAAMELNLDAFTPPEPVQAPAISGYPPVLLDLALVVADDIPASVVLAAVRDGAGELLESVRLFDVYRNEEQLGADRKSLAVSLRFRAPDRTLTVDEATAARDRAVAVAAERVGAQLRG